MIKVLIKENSIRIKGHANYSEYGKDIVCASVSSVIYTTVNSIMNIDKFSIEYTDDGNVITIKKSMCLVPKPSLWGRVGWGLFAFFGRPTCPYMLGITGVLLGKLITGLETHRLAPTKNNKGIAMCNPLISINIVDHCSRFPQPARHELCPCYVRPIASRLSSFSFYLTRTFF
jgi:hypothetical protein